MPSERIQRHIDSLLDDAESAVTERKWDLVRTRCEAILALDPENADARSYLGAAERGADSKRDPTPASAPATPPTPAALPTSFANGRYAVKKFLGEGGKKKVYLAHDSLLDRDVAFALIKGEGLDLIGRERVTREAQAMGRLGSHPHVVTVFDLGESDGQPFMVTELMGGGDVEGLLEKADGPLPPAQAIEIAKAVCRSCIPTFVSAPLARRGVADKRRPRRRRPAARGRAARPSGATTRQLRAQRLVSQLKQALKGTGPRRHAD
jgi:Protein kinase domain